MTSLFETWRCSRGLPRCSRTARCTLCTPGSAGGQGGPPVARTFTPPPVTPVTPCSPCGQTGGCWPTPPWTTPPLPGTPLPRGSGGLPVPGAPCFSPMPVVMYLKAPGMRPPPRSSHPPPTPQATGALVVGTSFPCPPHAPRGLGVVVVVVAPPPSPTCTSSSLRVLGGTGGPVLAGELQ